jgi:hypothetical protein
MCLKIKKALEGLQVMHFLGFVHTTAAAPMALLSTTAVSA